MGKEKRPFCCHQNFVPNMLSAPAGGYIQVEKYEKMCIKSDFIEIVLKLATNGQSDKGFLLTSTFVPKGLSAPALGLYTCIKALKYIPGPVLSAPSLGLYTCKKALKYIPGPGVRRAFTGPWVLLLRLMAVFLILTQNWAWSIVVLLLWD